VLDSNPVAVLVRRAGLEKEDQERVAVFRLDRLGHQLAPVVVRGCRDHALDRSAPSLTLKYLSSLDFCVSERGGERLIVLLPPVDRRSIYADMLSASGDVAVLSEMLEKRLF